MVDEKNGGFYGETDFYSAPNKTAAKGCILNSCILWTFSAAYRIFGDSAYKTCAQHARDFLLKAFLDTTHGGLYRLVDHTGKALNTSANGNERARKSLESLLHITLDKIVNRDFHFELFFDMDRYSLTKDISYGHDIEENWLLYEAALAIGDENLISKVKQTALAIAEVIYTAAIDRKNGGLISGCNAEGQTHGEWHNELSLDNSPDTSMPKAGFWKCPYHNARACFEVVRRMGE